MKPLITERGVSLQQGPSFYRAESVASRDLACLSAAVQRQHGSLRCLDLMAGSGGLAPGAVAPGPSPPNQAPQPARRLPVCTQECGAYATCSTRGPTRCGPTITPRRHTPPCTPTSVPPQKRWGRRRRSRPGYLRWATKPGSGGAAPAKTRYAPSATWRRASEFRCGLLLFYSCSRGWAPHRRRLSGPSLHALPAGC
jgi:hypothetical protein